MHVYTLAETEDWRNVLSDIGAYDYCHTPGYHQIAEQQGEGTAFCLVFRQQDACICLPLLLRPVNTAPSLANETAKDASSVYGYVGPVANGTISSEIMNEFKCALSNWLLEQHVVALFSRLHPLLNNDVLLRGLGDIVTLSKTISIDLTLPLDKQRAMYRKSNKGEINKLRRDYSTRLADSNDDIETFIRIYYENMHRVDARQYYFFDHNYFTAVLNCRDFKTFVLMAQDGDETMAAGMFICTGKIIQYHLAAAREEYLKLAPMKLILDEVRIWGTNNGYKHFHLGGGVGSAEDNLFLFKTGFSDRRHEFKVWKWIVNPEAYNQLVLKAGLMDNTSAYFPLYRAPIL